MGAGPIGLITALGLAHYGIASVVFEDDRQLSLETKAGTILSRTLEIFHRYGVADKVLAKAQATKAKSFGDNSVIDSSALLVSI